MKCGAIAVSVGLFLIGVGTLPPRMVAQGVDAGSQPPAGAATAKSSVSAYIEVRSVMPDDPVQAADEKPAAPRAGARGVTAPDNKAKAARKDSRPVVSYGLKYADYDRILETIPGIREAVAIREIPRPIRSHDRSIDGRVVGTSASYDKVNHLEMERGRFLTVDDHDKYQNRAVIGSEVARTLFPAEDPVGESVKLGSDYYTIVGVIKERASTSVISGRFGPHDFNRDVYIPLSTSKLRFGERIAIGRPGEAPRIEQYQLSRLTLQLRDDVNVEEMAERIRAILKPSHPKDDVEVMILRIRGKSR